MILYLYNEYKKGVMLKTLPSYLNKHANSSSATELEVMAPTLHV